MAYLIDGHNLIPKIPGLALSALDDEIRLIELLQEFCRISRKKCEVYFDNAPPGYAGSQNFGVLRAHFVPGHQTADQAIRSRLARIGKAAPNWTVVSSDGAIQSTARRTGARTLTSEAFASLLQDTLRQFKSGTGSQAHTSLTDQELEEWLTLFGNNRSNDSNN